jgi:hypothetical protein
LLDKKDYDPPIVEFRLETDEPLIFEDSSWPVWLPNSVLVTASRRSGRGTTSPRRGSGTATRA